MIHQQIQQCAQRCSDVANTLRAVANQAPDQRAREMLTAGAMHLEMCVHECDTAMAQTQFQAQPAQPQFQRGCRMPPPRY